MMEKTYLFNAILFHDRDSLLDKRACYIYHDRQYAPHKLKNKREKLEGTFPVSNEFMEEVNKEQRTDAALPPVLVDAEHSDIATIARITMHTLLTDDDPNRARRITHPSISLFTGLASCTRRYHKLKSTYQK